MVKIIDLTEREKQKIKRAMVYNLDKINECISNFDDNCDDNATVRINFCGCNFFLEFGRSFDEKGEEDEPIGFNYEIRQYFTFITFFDFSVKFEEDIMDILDEQIKKFKPLRFCDCKSKIFNDKFDLCESCYINICENEDNCPICLEHGLAIWVKNTVCLCKHYYHKNCFSKVKKCPTCRVPIGSFKYL